MRSPGTRRAALWVTLTTVASVLGASSARAADDDCVASHSEAQARRKQGRLIAARERLLVCSEKTCPELIRGDCAEWLAAVEKEIPSIVVVATLDGRDVGDVHVFLDDVEVAEELEGKPIALDPGKHRLRVERDGSPPVEREVIAKLGQQNQAVPVELGAPSSGGRPGDSSADAPPNHTLAYVLGGVGLVGLGAFAFFGLQGKNEYDRLKEECSPRCDASRSDSVRRDLLIADISLGVGLVGLGAATYLFVTAPSATKPRASAPPTRVSLSPLSGGGFLAVSGSL